MLRTVGARGTAARRTAGGSEQGGRRHGRPRRDWPRTGGEVPPAVTRWTAEGSVAGGRPAAPAGGDPAGGRRATVQDVRRCAPRRVRSATDGTERARRAQQVHVDAGHQGGTDARHALFLSSYLRYRKGSDCDVPHPTERRRRRRCRYPARRPARTTPPGRPLLRSTTDGASSEGPLPRHGPTRSQQHQALRDDRASTCRAGAPRSVLVRHGDNVPARVRRRKAGPPPPKRGRPRPLPARLGRSRDRPGRWPRVRDAWPARP
jgi:hypothetical protein